MAFAALAMPTPENAESPEKMRRIPNKVREFFMQAANLNILTRAELQEIIDEERYRPIQLRWNEEMGQLEWLPTKIVTQHAINKRKLAINFKNPMIHAEKKGTGSEQLSLTNLPYGCLVEVDVAAQIAVCNEKRVQAVALGNNDLTRQLQSQTEEFQAFAGARSSVFGRIVAVYRDTQEFKVQFVLDTPNATPRLLAATPLPSDSTSAPELPTAPPTGESAEPTDATFATTPPVPAAAAASASSSASTTPTSAGKLAPNYRVAASAVTEREVYTVHFFEASGSSMILKAGAIAGAAVLSPLAAVAVAGGIYGVSKKVGNSQNPADLRPTKTVPGLPFPCLRFRGAEGGLVAGRKYTVAVSAELHELGACALSEQITFECPRAPEAPTDLEIQVMEESSVLVKWSKPENALCFQLKFTVNNSNYFPMLTSGEHHSVVSFRPNEDGFDMPVVHCPDQPTDGPAPALTAATSCKLTGLKSGVSVYVSVTAVGAASATATAHSKTVTLK